VLALVWLQIQMNVLVILQDSLVGERRTTTTNVALERLLFGVVDDLVPLHLVRVNEHRTLIANDFLVRRLLVEESNVPQNMIFDLLTVVELRAALVAREKLFPMSVQVQRQLLRRWEEFKALVALQRIDVLLAWWVVGSKVRMKILQCLASTAAFGAWKCVGGVVLEIEMLHETLSVLESLWTQLAADFGGDSFVVWLSLVLDAVCIRWIVLAAVVLLETLLVEERFEADIANESPGS
jgi:hypothetical protein